MRVLNPPTLLLFSLVTAAQLSPPTRGQQALHHKTNRSLVTITYSERIAPYCFVRESYLRSAGFVTPRRDPNEVWREIKSLAEQEAVSPTQPFIRPLTMKIVGSTLRLTIKMADGGDLGFDDDPYQLPFKKQIMIETVRHSLATGPLQRPQPRLGQNRSASDASLIENRDTSASNSNADEQWQCYLDQAQHLVRQTIVAIETVSDKSQLKQLLRDAEIQIDEILYSQLLDSIAKYAEEHHHIVIYERGGTVKAYSVPLVSIPDGAKVWLMTDLVYRKQLIVRTDPTLWPWREMVQNPADLIGKYRYLARWPDGRHAEGSIDVTNSNPLRFQAQ